jgi:hypothetical protein
MSSEDADSGQTSAEIDAQQTPGAPHDDRGEPTLVAYELSESTPDRPSRNGTIRQSYASDDGFELVQDRATRDWMSATADRFANRCLPMLIANQAGWLIRNNSMVTFRWNGGERLDSVKFQYRDEKAHRWVTSHFGHGIVTWNFPFLFRTSPGYNLLVRGPANHFKDGIAPLEGIVESDWAPSTFTMSWKITRPGFWITFRPGDPVCMLVPQRRGELEAFHPRIRPLVAEPELKASYDKWSNSREQFLKRNNNGSEVGARDDGWQKHYFQGTAPDGSTAPEHQTRLRLRPFERCDGE